MTTFCTPCRRQAAVAVLSLLALLALTGCGNEHTTYPVHGQIVYSDGSPATDLEGYTVTFESVDEAATSEESGIGAWGTVQGDGTFTVGTYAPNDGAVSGKHRVAISPEAQLGDGPAPKFILPLKYAAVETSGLDCEVTSNENDFTFTVQRR